MTHSVYILFPQMLTSNLKWCFPPYIFSHCVSYVRVKTHALSPVPEKIQARGLTPLNMPSIGGRVFLPMLKARFEGFWTPFKFFSSIQSVGNFLNFNICFNVWVVFRLVFVVRAFKQHPLCFWPVFEPQNAILAMSPSEDLLFLIEAKFSFEMQSN